MRTATTTLAAILNRRHTELCAARARTDELFDLVPRQHWYDRSIPERHRLLFYLGHVDAFDWNLIARKGFGLPSFQPAFDQLFEFGIDPPPGQLPQDEPGDWPAIADVLAYRDRARELLDQRLDHIDEELFQVCLEHRLMHAETLAYLLHEMPAAHKTGPPPTLPTTGTAPRNEWLTIPAGAATLGRERNSGFGWDNEFPTLAAAVPAFDVQQHKVTNGEYLAFVEAGGPPSHFWTRDVEGPWKLRAMFGDAPLPLDHPVYVTLDQARAYAQWTGADIPTEPQWHRAAYATPNGNERPYPWGDDEPTPERGNFDFQSWDTLPVTAHPTGDSAFGAAQMVGNGWEWTRSEFAPFPGFANRPFYPGYSANFFDGAHYVLKGGSCRTAACMLRRSFRNWFRPNYPYLYATFRCVRETNG